LKVFLSRDQPSQTLADKARECGWELTCFSCIEKKLITSEEPPDADWIFFYSPGAVRLYFANFTRREYRFAALGKGTARALRESGIIPAFVGSFSSPQESVKEFAQNVLKNETILQAKAEDSFERLRNELSTQQLLDWPFYKTLAKKDFPEVAADYYILTSPSNARAYLNKHTLPPKAQLIVFGESTLEAIPDQLKARTWVTEFPGEEYALELVL